MPNSPSRDRQPVKPPGMDDETFKRLKAEALAPYRGLRRFIYYACAASGAIGGFVFLTQILAGNNIDQALPNLGVQIGVVALMVWLLRLEYKAEQKAEQKGDRSPK